MKEIVDLILQSKYFVALTGAGMSTESGLPDFRSHGGLWYGKNPYEIASPKAIGTSEFIAFYRNRIEDLQQYRPNIGHQILAKWEKAGYLKAILTQNIDGFHQQAGSQHVIEVHGHLRHLICTECQRAYPADSYRKGIEKCMEERCNGNLRPPIVLFGEELNPDSWSSAVQEVEKADAILVLGTSLTVYPFAGLVELAKETGARIAIINKTETELDHLADIIVHDSIGKVLGEVDQALSG
ncbi:NAD-dependent protein deacylase [Thermoflavimicrobium dichotomicum]|uniref:NAD-dependent protein deacylase n=1 Tax=Thermoflavimicrobium dichotomicum TaxID=46223 RepID=UPI000B88445D|nr:NAD-dependent protein deacylase [Thermoflavimicrobium dichotomicum]